MYSVKFTKRALKELNQLPKDARNSVIESLELLQVNPYAEILQVKKLRGQRNLYRIRIGNYRVIYEIYGGMLVIIVVRIGHRKDVYEYLRAM